MALAWFFEAQNAPKPISGWGSAPDPLRELTTPPRPRSHWEGTALPLPILHALPLSLRRLGLGAYVFVQF